MGAPRRPAPRKRHKTRPAAGASQADGVFVFSSFVFSGPYLWHMEVPRLGV